jgi:hypothetical protein
MTSVISVYKVDTNSCIVNRVSEVASSTVFDPGLISAGIRPAGLPELDRVAFGIG